MELENFRYSGGEHSTLGLLSDVTEGRRFMCYTLEDQYQKEKVHGETRIPPKRYRITLRTHGGKHQGYAKKFPTIHRGMLQILDVEGFTDVLIHIGNDDNDTLACLLTGDTAVQNITGRGFVGKSTSAYLRIYAEIVEKLLAGEEVWITYIDGDMPKAA